MRERLTSQWSFVKDSFRSELLIVTTVRNVPLYSMNPSFLNLFMKR